MQVLIASDEEQVARQVRELLLRNEMDCPAGHVVPLESAAARTHRLKLELLVVVLSPKPQAGLEALREVSHSVRGQVCVLAVGPATDAKLILKALREGADEYLDESLLEAELGAALARFRNRQVSSPRGEDTGRVVAVLGPSGGSGSSTLAANLSAVLAKGYQECGLIDLRLAVGDLTAMLDLKPTHTISDLCENVSRIDSSMFEQFLVRHPSGIHLLAAPRRYADIGKVHPRGVRQTLALARARFRYVVVDMDNAFGSEQIEALWQSDAILLVLRLDYTSVRNARRTMDNIRGLGISLDRLQLVVNRYPQPKQLHVAQAEEALEKKVSYYLPDDPGRVNRAINKGVPVVLRHPWSKLARSVKSMARSLNGQYAESDRPSGVRDR